MIAVSAPLATDPVEIARLDGLIRGTSLRNSQKFSLYLNMGVGMLYLVLGVVRVSYGSPHHPGLGYVWLALGAAYFVLVAIQLYSNRRRHAAKADTDLAVTISDAGLTFVPSNRALGWNALECISDVGGYFVFLDAFKNQYAAIATTDLPNEGRDLWRELDDLLMSKRYLIRSSMGRGRIVIDKNRRVREKKIK